ncbi:hypothetical protein ACFC8N_28350 [Streptomyces sp. NPDC055966]|uniref:hypothetical protein n=1 Tax=Streptomyces sp. NPDC055966 TaxID=3345669 RepID=UPI0035DD4D2F
MGRRHGLGPVTVRCSVRPGQGEATGFDLGDMVVTGDLGTADSAGRVPDQGMMIHLSVVTLLDQLRGFLRGDVRYLRYNGVDTSFTLVLRRAEHHVSVSGRDGLLGRTTGPELAAAALDAAEDLLRVHPLPPGDPVAGDYRDALARFRPFVASR